MNMDDALHTFIEESRDLLQQMEDALLKIEQNPEDADLVNAIFRAAHTIKGSAGLFALDHVVGFTHVAESVLDKVRSAELAIDAALVALFLESRDHIGTLIEHVAAGGEPGQDTHSRGHGLLARLKTYLEGEAQSAQPAPSSGVPVEHGHSIESEGGGAVETDNWHLSLRFGTDVLRNGMDPLSFIRYLGTLGVIEHVVTVFDSLPPAPDMDPETCYIGFEINFRSEVDKATIEGVFEFVREDCRLRILPPRAKIAEYQDLIRSLPEEEMRLGEMLVRCGTLTESELQTALQAQVANSSHPPAPIGTVLVEQSMVQPAVVEAALEKQKQVKENRSGESSFIRVDAEKLDHLINLVGELIIAGAGANIIAQREGMADLLEATATLSRLVEEVRDSALTLRMVQIGATFNRFTRVVRDMSKELGKEIDLVISGAETELDKTVVEKIGDPLTHLVRNSMDHGIESADVRRARGKAARGTVHLNAYHDSGSIAIEVSDDGSGLNRDRIFAKAVEKGLVAPDAVLTDKEVYNLIFEPGFSTAAKVSNLSGRGVGMDVVRRNIQALRGTVELDSVEGKGSTVRIRLPLTLAIIDGFLVGVGKAAYVIPLDMVVECVERAAWENGQSDGNYLNLRGEVLPFMKLRELFEVEGEPSRRENVVVVRHDGKKAGLVVDRLMGEFQTVIKPLGKVFSRTRGLSGFTILGNGEVALILDVPKLIQQSTGAELALYEGVHEASR